MIAALSVLVVDDNPGMRFLSERMLKAIGIVVVGQAENAEACMREIATHAYDVILMDISMPGVSGIELCGMVRAAPSGRATRIVACTAHAAKKDETKFLSCGFDTVLTKPFLLDHLRNALGVKA